HLLTFFTVGPKEARAWTVHKGATAPEAAGEIHSDFQKGFIRAETIAFDDYVALGGEAKAREAGKLRAEGKAYVVQDGDVMHFLHSGLGFLRERKSGALAPVDFLICLPAAKPWEDFGREGRCSTARTPPVSGTAPCRLPRIDRQGGRGRRGLQTSGRSFRRARRFAGAPACGRGRGRRFPPARAVRKSRRA